LLLPNVPFLNNFFGIVIGLCQFQHIIQQGDVLAFDLLGLFDKGLPLSGKLAELFFCFTEGLAMRGVPRYLPANELCGLPPDILSPSHRPSESLRKKFNWHLHA